MVFGECCWCYNGPAVCIWGSCLVDPLWRLCGIHTQLIELLMDLHVGTQAAVGMGAEVSKGLMCGVLCGRSV
jgi:hypothetical protein